MPGGLYVNNSALSRLTWCPGCRRLWSSWDPTAPALSVEQGFPSFAFSQNPVCQNAPTQRKMEGKTLMVLSLPAWADPNPGSRSPASPKPACIVTDTVTYISTCTPSGHRAAVGPPQLSELDNGEEQHEHQAQGWHLLDSEDCPPMWSVNHCSETKGKFSVHKVQCIPKCTTASILCSNETNFHVTRGGSPKPVMWSSCLFEVWSKATCQAFCQWSGRVISNQC